MKKCLVLFFLVLFVTPLWAQESVKPIKIGVVDIQKAIRESEAGKKAKQTFRARVKRTEARLLKEKQEVERLQNEFQKKSPLLKDEERQTLGRNIQKRQRGYELNMRDSQQELRQREADMTRKILKALHAVIMELGKRNKFTLIVERSQIPYADGSIDITDQIIKMYNDQTASKGSKGK
ncbi:MAG: OmpH family outer membrane protein [Candidatus Binatia bacterium]